MTDIEYLKKYLSEDKLEEGIHKLNQGIPVQYIVGNVNFYGYELDVNSHVLIPRFETEELVSKTIEYLKNRTNLKIADIGTGSGCIAITLKKQLDCQVDAVDISKEALEVAQSNAIKNNAKITFYQGNLLEPLQGKYDVIISNPPYIDREEEIMDIVKNNEPAIALYADHHGLACYEEILKTCRPYLNEQALIAFEIGYLQGDKILEIATQYLPEATISIQKDMQGKDRFVFIFMP